jgi:hypothetical protein
LTGKSINGNKHILNGLKYINQLTDSSKKKLTLQQLVYQQMTDAKLIEIADGSPQISFNQEFQEWGAEGHVLRCIVGAETDHRSGQPAIVIDDHELSWLEFGHVVSHFEGWGMRIVFVSEDELCNPPLPVVR